MTTWNTSYSIGQMVLRPAPLALAFPRMPEDEFVELMEDIKANGLRDNVIYTDNRGRVLDGWHRVRAASELGLKPHLLDFVKCQEKDPTSFVISRNMRRRHLSESQRATIAAELSNTTKSEAAVIGRGGTVEGKLGTKQASKVMNVSERSIKRAKRVVKANPATKDKLLSGSTTLNAEEQKIAPRKAPTTVSVPTPSPHKPATVAATPPAAKEIVDANDFDDVLDALDLGDVPNSSSSSGQSAPSDDSVHTEADGTDEGEKIAATIAQAFAAGGSELRVRLAREAVMGLRGQERAEFAAWYKAYSNG